MGITIAEIISLPDEFGKDLIEDLFEHLGNQGTHQAKVQLGFLVEMMDDLAERIDKKDLPEMDDEQGLSFDLETEVDGITYNRKFWAVKALQKAPIYELRLNIREHNYRLRITFFPKYHNDQLYYCFVFPFLKVDDGKKDTQTDHYKKRTYAIYQDLMQNFENYQQYFEES